MTNEEKKKVGKIIELVKRYSDICNDCKNKNYCTFAFECLSNNYSCFVNRKKNLCTETFTIKNGTMIIFGKEN